MIQKSNHALPEFTTFTSPGVIPQSIRPIVDGKAKFQRILIRRRQLKYEVGKFVDWIIHLIETEAKHIQEQKLNPREGQTTDYPPFFDLEDTALLILGLDRGEVIQAEIGTQEHIRKLIMMANESLENPEINTNSKNV